MLTSPQIAPSLRIHCCLALNARKFHGVHPPFAAQNLVLVVRLAVIPDKLESPNHLSHREKAKHLSDDYCIIGHVFTIRVPYLL